MACGNQDLDMTGSPIHLDKYRCDHRDVTGNCLVGWRRTLQVGELLILYLSKIHVGSRLND